MKAILLILIIALYTPLVGQIVFEELDDVHGTFLRSVDESRTGLHSMKTIPK